MVFVCGRGIVKQDEFKKKYRAKHVLSLIEGHAKLAK